VVQDSLVTKFNAGAVTVEGVDIWNSGDSLINSYIGATNVTFPVVKNGASIGASYSVIANSIVVIDKDAVVRFVQQLGTSSTTDAIIKKMVSDAASTVRTLLANRVVMPKAAVAIAGRDNGQPRYFTLSGQTISHPATAVRTGVIVRRLNGQATAAAVQYVKPNP